MKTTFNDSRSPADICKEHGWKVGTRLIGDEGYGPTIIEITAIGKSMILAIKISHNGVPCDVGENSWVLWCRDWREDINAI